MLAYPDSIRVLKVPLLKWKPTAVHVVAEAQEMPFRAGVLAGLGLDTRDQRVPSQDSIRVLVAVAVKL